MGPARFQRKIPFYSRTVSDSKAAAPNNFLIFLFSLKSFESESYHYARNLHLQTAETLQSRSCRIMSFRHIIWIIIAILLVHICAGENSSVEKSEGEAAMENDPYKSSSFIGHSLWMCPSGASGEAYSSIIGETSAKLGTFRFLPHITLVAAMMTGADDVVQRTRELAKQLAPYTFEFEELSQRDAYFQCVFAKMKRSKEVVDANNLAREIFPERRSDPEYTPHLSLIYGDFDLQEKESKLIPELDVLIQEKVAATKSFRVDAIEVWSTQGDVKDWYLVETIPLEGDGTCENTSSS